MISQRKVVLFIAMSLDGFIAGVEDNLNFLSLVEKEGEDYGYQKFVSTVDTVIMGRKTFDKVISMVQGNPHQDKKTIVFSRQARQPVYNEIYYSGLISDLITDLKKEKGKTIYCDGGAEIVQELLKNKLIDEIIISVVPVLIGDGIRLFKEDRPEQKLTLFKSTPFDTGLVQLHYKCS